MKAKFVNENFSSINNPEAKKEAAESIKFHISKRENGKYFSVPIVRKHLKEDLFWAVEGSDEGKSIGYKYTLWSERAIEQYNHTHSDKDLRTEHAYPRNLLVKHLMKNRDTISVDEIIELLEIYMHGIIVTLQEDRTLLGGPLVSNMPAGLEDNKSQEYVFSRYTTTNINVMKVHFEKREIVVDGYFIKDGKIIL